MKTKSFLSIASNVVKNVGSQNILKRSAHYSCFTSRYAKSHHLEFGNFRIDNYRGLCTAPKEDLTDESSRDSRHGGAKPEQGPLDLSQSFDPPTAVRKSLPSGFLGSLQVHLAARIRLTKRIACYFQKRILVEVLDPTFSFDEFLEGAKAAYVVIRQITSNVKDPEKLHVLDEMVSPTLLKVLKKNIADSSMTDKNKGLEVHDVFAEVVSVNLRCTNMEPPSSSDLTLQEAQARGQQLMEQGDVVRLRVRFVALETPVLRPGGGVAVERGEAEVVVSTWTLEGRVWDLTPPDPTLEAPRKWQQARRRRSELVWQLLKVRI